MSTCFCLVVKLCFDYFFSRCFVFAYKLMIFAWSFSLKRIISNEKNYNYPVDKTVSKVVICKWFFVLIILKLRKISQPALNLDLFVLEDFYITHMFCLDFFPKKLSPTQRNELFFFSCWSLL